MSRWKGMKSALPAILVTGLSFSITELLVSNLLGATLTAVLASLVCLAATSFYLSRWKPAVAWRFATDEALEAAPVAVGQKVAVGGGVVTTTSSGGSSSAFHPKELFLAWLPYLLLAVLVILVNLPAGAGGTQPLFAGKAKGWEWLAVKFQIYNPNKLYVFPWLQSPGTIMLIAGLIAAPFLRIRMGTFGEQIGKTAKQMIPSFIAVASILSIAEVMNLALPIVDPKTKLAIWGALDVKQISIVNTMANAIVAGVANWVYPFIAPVFGAIGVFLTGSNTSSNALFGNLQKFTAHGMGLSDILMASAGNAGSTAGKMISPQSLVIAATAVGVLGKEGALMRQTIKYTVPYLLLLGLMTWAYAFVFPGLVP
jgi:lactate permease